MKKQKSTTKQPTPKFGIGDIVKCPPSLYKETQGEVIECNRLYKELNPIGRFDRHGLVTSESSIKSICLPFRFDGETLEVDHPETDFGGFIQKAFTSISKFYGYSYCLKMPGVNTVYSEKSLTLIKKANGTI